MSHHTIAILFKRKQVCKFVQQGDQERICVEISVYTDTMIVCGCAVTVIAEQAFPFMPGIEAIAGLVVAARTDVRRIA